MSPLTHIDSAHGVEDGKSVDAVVVGGCGQAPPPSVPARPASAVPANAETWALLRQLPLDVSRRIVAQGDVLEVFSPLQQTSMSHLRLAAQLWRRVCALSRAHRQAAEELLCSCCLPIKLEAPSCFTHPSCSRLQAWQQLVASQPPMRGLSSGLLEVWTRLPNLAVELRSLRRLTLTSVPGRSPNSFEACQLPDLPCLEALRLLDYSRMELAGLPPNVKRVTLVPPTPAAHFTACWLAPLGSLPTHRLDSLTIGRRRKPAGQYHTVVALNLHRLCRAAASVLVHGSHTVLCLPTSGRPPRRFRLREDRCCQTLADTFLASGADQLALAMQPTDKVFMLQLPPNSSRLCCGCKEAAGVSALLGELVGEEDAARVARPADLAVACAVACAAALAKDCTAAFRDHDRWASIHHRLPKAIRRRLMYMRQHEHTVVPMMCGFAKRTTAAAPSKQHPAHGAVPGRLVGWLMRLSSCLVPKQRSHGGGWDP